MVSTIASAVVWAIEILKFLVCAVKFVNSFARCQHLFDIAAMIDADSNFLPCPAPCSCFNFAQNVIM